MDTSTATITIEMITITINNKTKELSKVNNNENKISKFVNKRIIHGILMTKIKINWR